MCGIGGFFDQKRQYSSDRMISIAKKMLEVVANRGPDGNGYLVDAEAGVCLVHTRLAIIDLSPSGEQPMASNDGRYVCVFNGEIYNHQSLHQDMTSHGYRFRGTSDTEVMVACFSMYGVSEAITKLNGVFAVSVWDRLDRKLHFFRDRLGEKPLYWSFEDNLLWFGSDMSIIRAIPIPIPNNDPQALSRYLQLGYIPCPMTILEGVRKLSPGTHLTIDLVTGVFDITKYWSLRHIASSMRDMRRRPLDDVSVIDQLEALILDSVSRQMVSDVPLGALLSGGIDSSLVVAMMQRISSKPIQTFTAGFTDGAFDETNHARQIAAYLGTDHHEFTINEQDVLDAANDSFLLTCEPFSDYSIIPTSLLCRQASKHVKVVLSGDGGDELFGGYNSYKWVAMARSLFHRNELRSLLKISARHLPEPMVSFFIRIILGAKLSNHMKGERLERLRQLGAANTIGEFANSLNLIWHDLSDCVQRVAPQISNYYDDVADDFDCDLEVQQFVDTVRYLPDDILTKIDRASMNVGLEARVPMLDYRCVEFAWSVGPHYKLRGQTQKWALRQVLNRYIPDTLYDRPKMGFTPPMGKWLRGPLRDMADDLLSESQLNRIGSLNIAKIQERWQRHRNGDDDFVRQIWAVIALSGWKNLYLL